MNEAAQRMGDPDGSFVREFQTQFHARLFELACFIYLDVQGLTVDRSHRRPDFALSRDGVPVATIEAVTANSPAGQQRDISVRTLARQSVEEIVQKCNEEFPIRVGSALFSKLGKRYWDLPHCKDLPFVLAVGPFHEPGSTTYIDQSLARYLYGMEQVPEWIESGGILTRQLPVRQHTFSGKTIPSGFFTYPDAENVSAVIYCNQFTVPRFFRMAAQADGWPADLTGTRMGAYLDPADGPSQYQYALDDPRSPTETWDQGVTVLHNPNALHPLPPGALQSTAVFRIRDGSIDCEVGDLHPLTSFMVVGVLRDQQRPRSRRPRRRAK